MEGVAIPVYDRSEVFVPGGQPTVTYNPRPAQGAGEKVHDYLREGREVLCLTGPSKSGKTVLAREVIPHSIRVVGGEVSTIDDFWSDIADSLQAFTEEVLDTSDSEAEVETDTLGMSAKVFGSGIDASKASAKEQSRVIRQTLARKRSPRRASKEALEASRVPLVIDDFHHLEPDLQRRIIRGVKDLVSLGVPVIIIAVPHQAAAVIRGEPEMQGRVRHIEITSWTTGELDEIAVKGFNALNIECPSDFSADMAKEAYGSPHLMQEFCLQICKTNDVTETLGDRADLFAPEDPDGFFANIAEAAGDQATVARLAQGPRQRTDRIERRLKSGTTTDIYGAVLAAIAHTGPKVQLNWTEIRIALRTVLADEPPRRSEYTRVLEQMSDIAKNLVWEEEHERYSGDPALEYDPEYGTLHISDPYFAFQLRWSPPTP